MDLIVLGTVALDNIQTASGLKKNLLGGSAAHFSMSASLFSKVHIASVIGDDFPVKHRSFLEQKGINTRSLLSQPGPSFAWTGEYREGDYNNAITVKTELGVLLNYKPFVADEQKNIPYVFLANFDPELQMAFLRQMNKPTFVGLDTMNLWIHNQKKAVTKLMKKVHLFVVNDGEACAISGETNIIKAAKKLRRMGPAYVVVKKGEHGVLFYCDQFMFSYSAYPVEKVIDPTGAGDTFAGGLMGYLSKTSRITEKVMSKAVIYATTLASFNVEGFGMAKTAPLTMNHVNQRMRRYCKFISPH